MWSNVKCKSKCVFLKTLVFQPTNTYASTKTILLKAQWDLFNYCFKEFNSGVNLRYLMKSRISMLKGKLFPFLHLSHIYVYTVWKLFPSSFDLLRLIIQEILKFCKNFFHLSSLGRKLRSSLQNRSQEPTMRLFTKKTCEKKDLNKKISHKFYYLFLFKK